MAQLTAPVLDVLIVGDVEPTANQDLDKRDIELAYRIRVVSPTGLFDAFDLKFFLPKSDSNRAADRVADAMQQSLTRLPGTLAQKRLRRIGHRVPIVEAASLQTAPFTDEG